MVFYKLPGLEAMALSLALSATTEMVKEYLRDQHMITRRFNVRIYVQGNAVYLAKEKTLEECGVKPDSTMAVLYADPAEKKRERRAQAKETAVLVRKDVVAQANRVIASQKQPNERSEAVAKIAVDGALLPRTGEQTDAERFAEVRML